MYFNETLSNCGLFICYLKWFRFRPHTVASKIGDIVFKKLEVGAYQWSKISTEHKEQMFGEFKVHNTCFKQINL